MAARMASDWPRALHRRRVRPALITATDGRSRPALAHGVLNSGQVVPRQGIGEQDTTRRNGGARATAAASSGPGRGEIASPKR